MQPKPTVVTFRPVLPRMRYWKAGLEDSRTCGEAVCGWGESVERDADAMAGRVKPATRKLRRDAERVIYESLLQY